MSKPSKDHSIFDEPHIRGEPYQADPSESVVDRKNLGDRSDVERIEQSVWDEPGISSTLAGAPREDETYAHWFQQRRAETSWLKSWWTVLLISLAAGPWAVIGAFFSAFQGESMVAFVSLVLFGPMAEEIMKASMALYFVEKRPYLFRSAWQISICLAASGLAFAVIENFLYLHVYIDDPSPELVYWRWTVCVGLHMGCSVIAGLGVIRMWRYTWTNHLKAPVALAASWLAAAVVLHGLYNGLATAFEMFGGGF